MRGVVLFLCATLACFGDITGKWAGAVLPGNNGESVPISFELRQKGNRVIGVAITNESGICTLLNGVITGPKISFDIRVDKELVHFDFTLAGEKMQGQALGKRDEGGDDGPVAVSLDRQITSRAAPFSGTWAGIAEGTDSGQKRFEYFTLILRQNGGDITGAITDPGENEHAIKNPKLSADGLTFEVDRLQASLTLAGDKLTGTGTVESGGSEQVLKLTLTRDRPAATGPAGRWAGIGEISENGETKRFPIFFHFQQSISGLSGKCIDSAGKAFDISSGALNGNKLTFDVASTADRVHFDMVLDGDELKGQGTRAGENGPLKVVAVRRME